MNPERAGMNTYLKNFLTTAAVGTGFGLVAVIVIFLLTGPPAAWSLYLLLAALISSIVSGLAGLGATVMELALQKRGVRRESARTAISYIIVSLLTFLIFYGALTWLDIIPDYPDSKRYTLGGTLAGLTFGAAYAVYHYRKSKARRRLLMLEMENRHLAELASREELLREAARNLAVAEERSRMARELHDSIAQGIHGITYSLRTLKTELKDNPRGLEIHGYLEETAANTLKELRRLVAELNPSPLEDHNLDEALRLHCDLFARRQQLDLSLNLDYDGSLSPEQEVALYRIAQEALANIQKHAAASKVQVTLRSTPDSGSESAPAETVLTISDNGRGFDVSQKKQNGNGLLNMAARARQNGGSFAATSQPGRGTTVTVRF